MQTLTQIIDDRLANAGDTLSVVGHLNEDGYHLGGHSFSLPEGVDYDLLLTNAGEGILATGMLTAHIVGTCDRCLGPAEFDLTGEVDEYYLFHEPTDAAAPGESDEEEDIDYSLVGPDHTVDLTDALNSALIMETPYVVLCRDDCKGLCPVCGADLNVEDCGHANEIVLRREQERLAASPFAVLRDLGLGDQPGDTSSS